MALLYFLLSLLFALVAAAYLQLPTFMLFLGYRWFHQYRWKRQVLRALSVGMFILFAFEVRETAWVVAGGLVVMPIGIFSLFNANPKVYIALSENEIDHRDGQTLADAVEVLGYADEQDRAIAYPLEEMIQPRHVLNEVFAGRPILIAYCMACRSALVLDPVVQGRRLTFDVIGVYRRNMVMADRETGTLWQQATGEAVCGVLKGTQLPYLPYQLTEARDWFRQYPNSQSALENKKVRKGVFSKKRLMKMMKITERLIAPGRTDLSGLPPREEVFGVVLNGSSKAYPVTELRKTPQSFDSVGGVELEIRFNPETHFLDLIRIADGRRIPVQSHWWFGWKEFHPHTQIWKSPL